jgi:hypothetical protein
MCDNGAHLLFPLACFAQRDLGVLEHDVSEESNGDENAIMEERGGSVVQNEARPSNFR